MSLIQIHDQNKYMSDICGSMDLHISIRLLPATKDERCYPPILHLKQMQFTHLQVTHSTLFLHYVVGTCFKISNIRDRILLPANVHLQL